MRKYGKSLRAQQSGQVVTEYVAVLALLLMLTLAMFFLLRALGEEGARTTELVSSRVP